METESITIARLPIRLGQFLKFANLVQDGIEAKIRIAEGEVKVNGDHEMRRGRQLQELDIVEFAQKKLQITAEP